VEELTTFPAWDSVKPSLLLGIGSGLFVSSPAATNSNGCDALYPSQLSDLAGKGCICRNVHGSSRFETSSLTVEESSTSMT